MNFVMRKSVLEVIAAGAALLAITPSLYGTPPGIGITGNGVELDLPGPAAANTFRAMEWSSDMIHWEPVARDYGTSWENVFPHALSVSPGTSNQVLTDGTGAPQRFYRMNTVPANPLANAHAVSRFLQQATFGPTRTMIANFPGINEPSGFNDPPYTYFQQWIDAEMAKPLTSLRAFWRERSNPAYVAGTDPYEVAHNSTYR